jgi:hypothetical protein
MTPPPAKGFADALVAAWGALGLPTPVCSGWYACPACGGSGEVMPEGEFSPGGYVDYCSACRGDGDQRVSHAFVYRPVTQAWART